MLYLIKLISVVKVASKFAGLGKKGQLNYQIIFTIGHKHNILSILFQFLTHDSPCTGCPKVTATPLIAHVFDIDQLLLKSS